MALLGPVRRGVGRGKLILFGEHAAVHGHPALGIPLDLETRVTLEPVDSGWTFPGLEEADAETVRRVLERLGCPPEGRAVRLSSNVPRAAGFGSSAALCVALAAALAPAAERSRSDVWERAHRAETLFHGTPSGIDTGLALLRGMRVFYPRPPALPLEERLPDVTLHLVVARIRRSASTAALVASVGRRLDSGDAEARRTVRELGRCAEEARDAVLAGQEVARSLGRLATEAHELLASLGLSTPETDALLQRGRRRGALGGKLSGAGGGGAAYLIAPDAETAERLTAELADSCAWVRHVLWSGGESRGASP